MRRLVWLAAVIVGTSVIFTACGSDLADDAGTATDAAAPSPTQEPPSTPTIEAPVARDLDQLDPTATVDATGTDTSRYPPGTEPELAALIDPLVEDLGLQFTYGSLINRGDGSFDASPTGDHLAVYVEPVGEYTDDEFIENLWVLAARLTPMVFDAYAGLESWDICQEPRPADNPMPRPPPATQLDITRDAAATVDWAGGSLSDLIVAARTFDDDVTIRLEPDLQQVPAFAAALTELGS